MKTNIFKATLLHISLPLLFVITTVSAKKTLPVAVNIIPQPNQITVLKKGFTLSKKTVILAPAVFQNEAQQLQQLLGPATGYTFNILSNSNKRKRKSVIRFIQKKSKQLGKEGYQLTVTPNGITIKASHPTGAYYGVQTLVQLLPVKIIEKTKQENIKWYCPGVKITDKPRFSWRAFMLDEGRYFKGMKVVKKLLDQMAAMKMNVFHWHLTEDQGWRIEIKKYPRLTTVGSKRKDSQIGGWGSPHRSGKPHSGFYTQAEIKEIVAYAAKRHITIVPEIGMPGHATAAIASYPYLGTTKKQVAVWSLFGKAVNAFDPADERVYQFASDVFDEVITLFPSKYIHIGGDEVRFEHWKKSPAVKKLMQKKGLKTMADVQLYFTNRISNIIKKKGRILMGWNEIVGDDLHGFLKDGQTASSEKLDKDAVVHFWKGSIHLAKKAIKAGHSIVNSDHGFTYLDYSHGSIPVHKAYKFNPVINGLNEEEQKRILGLGCQMWGEWIPTIARMEHQVYPRIAAYAEVGWTELQNKKYANFLKALNRKEKQWDILNINYAKSDWATLDPSDFFNHQKVAIWSPKNLGTGWVNFEFPVNSFIKAKGKYECVFLYSKGAHALEMKDVVLLENDKVIAQQKHQGFSGHNLKKCVYKFTVKKFNPNAKYSIRAKIKGSDGNDSYGEIKMR